MQKHDPKTSIETMTVTIPEIPRGCQWLLIAAFSALIFTSGCTQKKQPSPEVLRQLVTLSSVGWAFLEENKLAEAEAQFQKMIELAPENHAGYANLAYVYLRMGEYSKSEQQAREALRRDDSDALVYLILAEVYDLTQRDQDAAVAVEEALKREPENIKVLYKKVQFLQRRQSEDAARQRQQILQKLASLEPANLVVRLQLTEALLKSGQGDAALAELEAIRQQIPELPAQARPFFRKAIDLLHSGEVRQALTQFIITQNFLRVTPLYQAGLRRLEGPGATVVGEPIVTLSTDFAGEVAEGEDLLDKMRFTDASEQSRLVQAVPAAGAGRPLAVADFDGDGDVDLFFGSVGDEAGLLKNEFGRFENVAEAAGVAHSGRDVSALFADYDNDGKLDLFVAGEKQNRLYHSEGDSLERRFVPGAARLDGSAAHKVLFADFDHDGDLDLYLAGPGKNRFWRNNADGSFTERARFARIAGDDITSLDAAFGDFDDDGDLDLLVLNKDGSLNLYSNQRQGQFRDRAVEAGLQPVPGARALAVGDVNNDGFLDIFLSGDQHVLLFNSGEGRFRAGEKAHQSLRPLDGLKVRTAAFFDFNNDGYLDLLAGGIASGMPLRLLHNRRDGSFEPANFLLPEIPRPVHQVVLFDYNEDGDQDVLLALDDGTVRLLRNDGGNINHYFNLQLVGLGAGSGKNNHFGIGAKVEVRAGDLYQMRVVTAPATHLGLGHRLKADVVRILWPNGVPQNLFYPRSDQDLIEEQILKGSCAFLYAWNGESYEFVTDIMWRSALGMPLGIMAGEMAWASHKSTDEYLKIPGDRIVPQNGKIRLQITEELWESAYFDKLRLVAVDHPDTVEIFMDERFIPPHLPQNPMVVARDLRPPASVQDGLGRDVRGLLLEQDDQFVASFHPGPYQGITEPHELIITPEPGTEGHTLLLLSGWLFPADASINVAVAQSGSVHMMPPVLQVPDADGRWQTVEPDLSFPMGKNKTIVVDLTGKYLSQDRRVRIRTTMQIYWDRVAFAVPLPELPEHVRRTELAPAAADLHYRGFSRPFRKGGRYGPHWFDYNEVSTEQKWRDLEGWYTRYGEVGELLQESDDMYVLLNAGDEVTVDFDIAVLPELPAGWKRDYLIYTDGWIKDGDLNTAHGNTVGPLPFHGMSAYPYDGKETFPDNPRLREWHKKYNTRRVDNKAFRERLRRGDE